ncbi:MAG: DUF1573 domain-containing protein [Pirellulaceae bacterium]
MIRVLLTALIAAGLGIGLGYSQASIQNSGIEERFLAARTTIAEQSNQMTTEEILDATKSKGNPRLEVVGGTNFDFGTMMHGGELSHDFVFKNMGDGPLVLDMGESSCKCTVGELSASVLQPGEETNVTLTWKALALVPDFGQSATILTNDVENLEVKLAVEGQVVRSVTAVPDKIQLGTIADDEEINKTIFLFSYLDDVEILEDRYSWTDDLTRKIVSFKSEKVDPAEAGIREHRNAKHAYRVDFHAEAGFPIGRLSSKIQYRTSNFEEVGSMEIPVVGNVAGLLQVQGGKSFNPDLNLVDFGNVKSEEGAKVSLFLFVHGKERDNVTPEIVSLKPEEALTAQLDGPKKTASRDIYTLRLEVPKGAPEVYYPARSKETKGFIVLRTKGSVEKETMVNVKLQVKGGKSD